MEASFVNFVGSPGSPVVVGVNGVFGERMCQVGEPWRCRGHPGRRAYWGEPIDTEQLLGAHPSPSIIAIVHVETSTGVRNDIALARIIEKGDALLLVDMVTSLGGIDVAVDEWGVDIAVQRDPEMPGRPALGLSPLTISDRARAGSGSSSDLPVGIWT